MRKSGVLMHISSLPGPFGIGSFGKEAFEFVDFLRESGQSYWQVLPLGPTGYGDSPYSLVSAFAGNPYFIDLEELADMGLLIEEDIFASKRYDLKDRVDYEFLFKNRIRILKKAYNRGFIRLKDDIESFKDENEYWLEDYSIYMTLKYINNQQPYHKWKDEFKRKDRFALELIKENYAGEIEFWNFIQYLFYRQWYRLKNYANKRGIEIIGDIPIYLSRDSVDIWANPEYFCLDENLNPKLVSGVPPDDFSKGGQLWGDPIYDWEALGEDRYSWWIARINQSRKLYDRIRIDHFRGFESFWAIPSDSKSAVKGTWVKGPDIELFQIIEDELGDVNVIAEDLGFLTQDVRKLKKKTGYPGMNILQFAFDGDSNNQYLPHNYIRNSVTYTGTHDNMTIKEFESSLDQERHNYIEEYGSIRESEGFNWALIRLALSSISDTAIIPIQDILGLGKESRMNTPSTDIGNWTWRLKRDMLSKELLEKLYKISKLYGRC